MKPPFKEEFLHYLWRMKKFSLTDLCTTQGETIDLYDTGTYNTDGGPDFSNARLKIGDTKWAGNVEIHLLSHDWQLHGHQKNKAYDSVVLHVVYEENAPAFRTTGKAIPCLELKGRFDEALVDKYLQLIDNEEVIPCAQHLLDVSTFTKTMWLERLIVERLERKSADVRVQLEAQGSDWEEVFYQFLAANFGAKINAEPFRQVAHSLPQKVLAKHSDSQLQLEALLFGQAGFLQEDLSDDYPRELQKEYRFLQKKYQLTPIPKARWQFLRLRPASFPTIRLAQFAALTFRFNRLFSHLLEVQTIKDVEELFDVQMSDYWQTHYTFDKDSKNIKKSLGKKTIELFIINTIVPFLFLYGKIRDDEAATKKALQFMEALPSENNRIIRDWGSLDIRPNSAYESQALIQLKNEYCNKKKCLQCAIGHAILK